MSDDSEISHLKEKISELNRYLDNRQFVCNDLYQQRNEIQNELTKANHTIMQLTDDLRVAKEQYENWMKETYKELNYWKLLATHKSTEL